MTLMFTHKANGAWDALTKSLVEAGFVITASWPINTEAEGSLHIKDKSAAKSTIFLVCRVRANEAGEIRHWDDIEPDVAAAVRRSVERSRKTAFPGSIFASLVPVPALQVFSEAWSFTFGEPQPAPKQNRGKKAVENFDQYTVTPKDALNTARHEVKNWRLQRLARVNRHRHLDALTEWFVLAWDAFRAPRFPADEAMKLAVGLDLDLEPSVLRRAGEL